MLPYFGAIDVVLSPKVKRNFVWRKRLEESGNLVCFNNGLLSCFAFRLRYCRGSLVSEKCTG